MAGVGGIRTLLSQGIFIFLRSQRHYPSLHCKVRALAQASSVAHTHCANNIPLINEGLTLECGRSSTQEALNKSKPLQLLNRLAYDIFLKETAQRNYSRTD